MKPRLRGLFSEIAHEFKLIGQMLLRPSAWIIIGVLAVFGVVGYFAVKISLRYSDLSYMVGVVDRMCHPLENWHYLVIIFAIFFCVIAMIYCLGNVLNYFSAKARGATAHQTRLLAVHAVLGGMGGIIVAGGMTIALFYWC